MKKKIILAIILIIILLGAGVAYAYFATDAFKSEKDLFFSYIINDRLWEDEEESKLEEYLEKQRNTPYTNKGEISANISGIENSTIEMLNDSKITFEGKTDLAQKMQEQEITMKLSTGINIPVTIKHYNETYGIQTNLIDKKFVAIRNENLKALAERFGYETEEIPDKIDSEELLLTQEEIKTLKDKYLKILNENLSDDLFSKTKSDKQTIVTLSMDKERFIEVTTKLLDAFKEDEIIQNKICKLYNYDKEDIKDVIDELISGLKTEMDEVSKIDIKVYIESKEVKKYDISIYEGDQVTLNEIIEDTENGKVLKIFEGKDLVMECNITKQVSQNDVSYKIEIKTYEEIEKQAEITMQYKNLLTLDNVEESFNIKISYKYNNDESSLEPYDDEEDIDDDIIYPELFNDSDVYASYAPENIDISLNYTNLKTFVTNVQIEKFNEENAIILNDATDEELENLMLKLQVDSGILE